VRPTPAKLAPILCGLHLAVAGGAEPPRVEALWPLAYYARGAEATELELLGPLGFYRDGPDATAWGLRPLATWRRDKRGGRSWLHVVYPLGSFRSGAKGHRHFVFPVYYDERREAPGGKPWSATVVFPLVWWGRHPEEGSWFFVLFVGGTAKGLLGKDEIVYGGFTYIKERTGDYVVRHYVWPLVSIGRGGGRRVLRVWPFYGRAEQEGQWWNGYVLWPFVTYGERESAKGKAAASFVSLWPLVGWSRARDGSGASWQALWPLFFYAWGTHKGYREWRLPLPFVVGKRTDDVQAWNLWPLFGRRRTRAGTESYYLWPLVHHSRVRTKRQERTDLKVFPLFSRVVRSDAKAGTRRSYWLLYPLLRWRSAEAGGEREVAGNGLQLAWVADSAGFDRSYNALLGLFEHARARDGRRATRLLWRAFRSERGPGWRYVQLGPLASWTRGGGLTKSSYLLGLVQTGRRNGRRGWRILYVPFGASLSRSAGAADEGVRRGSD